MTDRIYPDEMTPELSEALGQMCFVTGPLAHVFQAAGEPIEKSVEAEQAFILHTLIKLVLDHGPDWRDRFHAMLEVRVAAARESQP